MIASRVLDILDALGTPYAVIGAVAVAARGAPRSTFDLDLFTTEVRVLSPSLWTALQNDGVEVVIHKGDSDDPLAGVVRIGAAPDRIDLVVGRWKWEQGVIERAELADVQGTPLRVPRTADLILLKLAAGGPIDQQDIIRLLAVGLREALIREVDERIADLPDDARELWKRIIAATQ